ncbi:hypothetical protein STAFG_3564 [Streptomyces afghaniensis 772]|uniref:Uncharacterized protein n=1 Tax=Streptomyces afghaniensis 772 TaxID=1283301 RepID=S4MQ19_9ACTN|nr:hypothetical protein STAFG_5280 [Streptomyces afghaniensis 772]EPJ39348.1 hypothetical protein STAFG_3564 [Streptomyces afghaniensis 772]
MAQDGSVAGTVQPQKRLLSTSALAGVLEHRPALVLFL